MQPERVDGSNPGSGPSPGPSPSPLYTHHRWITHPPLLGEKEFCKVCGFVRNAGNSGKPCPGPTVLRPMEGQGPMQGQGQGQPETKGADTAMRKTSPVKSKYKPGCTLSVRVTAAERRVLDDGARETGLSVANYLRHLLGWPKAVMGPPRRH